MHTSATLVSISYRSLFSVSCNNNVIKIVISLSTSTTAGNRARQRVLIAVSWNVFGCSNLVPTDLNGETLCAGWRRQRRQRVRVRERRGGRRLRRVRGVRLEGTRSSVVLSLALLAHLSTPLCQFPTAFGELAHRRLSFVAALERGWPLERGRRSRSTGSERSETE